MPDPIRPSPTTGISSLTVSDLDPDHLRLLSDVFLYGSARHIFVSDKVGRLLQSTRKFRWLSSNPTSEAGGLKTYYRSGDKSVYKHLHFSNYGRFQERLDEEAALIKAMIWDA